MQHLSNIIAVLIVNFVTIATAVLGYMGYRYTKKRNNSEDVKTKQKEDIADAVALSGAVNDIGWIREQLGEKPNGGGAMEQILNNQKVMQTNQNNMQELIVSFSASLREHLSWHVARDH